MKVIFTGSQGTGKTTILNHYREQGYNCITEVVRCLSKKGININEMGDTKGQHAIFNTYLKEFSKSSDFISDRGLTDVIAYTKYLYDRDRVDPREYLAQQDTLKKFVASHPDMLYFYFPVEFPVVDDKVRSVDEDFRKEIDNNIKIILHSFNIPYVEVTGSVEKRINIIDKTFLLESLNHNK